MVGRAVSILFYFFIWYSLFVQVKKLRILVKVIHRDYLCVFNIPVDHENVQFSSQVKGQSSISLDLNMLWKKTCVCPRYGRDHNIIYKEMYGNKIKNFLGRERFQWLGGDTNQLFLFGPMALHHTCSRGKVKGRITVSLLNYSKAGSRWKCGWNWPKMEKIKIWIKSSQ